MLYKNKLKNYIPVAAFTLLASCNNTTEKNISHMEPKLNESNITYKIDSLTMDGYIVYDENVEGKRPGVIVVHEWWGLNDYTRMRARELAKLGYIAMAMDMYGNGQRAESPDSAGKLATPFYMNPEMAKKHFDAALYRLKIQPQTDTSRIGGIGYCFGGGMLLNFARMGTDLKGIVSFHGSLIGTPADKNLLKAQLLVLHGADDKFVPESEVAAFKKQMDSIGANYNFIAYPGATHAFTNPNATAVGEKYKIPIAYNAAADTASWKAMKEFFEKVFKK